MADEVTILTPGDDAPLAVMHREMREATERHPEPEPLPEFVARVGIGPGEAVPVVRSCFGTFAQEPETNRWVWVGTETPDPANFAWLNEPRMPRWA